MPQLYNATPVFAMRGLRDSTGERSIDIESNFGSPKLRAELQNIAEDDLRIAVEMMSARLCLKIDSLSTGMNVVRAPTSSILVT